MTTDPPSAAAGPSSGFRLSGYSARARLAPALLTASPVLALGVSALPLLEGVQKLWSVLSLGLVSFASLLARKAGNRVQAELWTAWGGAPTARRLRYRESESHAEVTRRHRDIEQALRATVTLPTAQQEDEDPVSADIEYQHAVRRFVGNVRNHPSYQLLTEENRNYGFARNLYGLKGLGRWLCGGVLAAALAIGILVGMAAGWSAAKPMLIPMVVSLVGLLLWQQVDPNYVRPSGEAYADRLLEAAQKEAAAVRTSESD